MRVPGLDSLNQFALFGVSGNDRIGMPGALLQRRLLKIEPKPGFAHFRIWAVATEAISRQNRLYVLVEIEVLRVGYSRLPAVAARCE
jgi:hypothetical protein